MFYCDTSLLQDGDSVCKPTATHKTVSSAQDIPWNKLCNVLQIRNNVVVLKNDNVVWWNYQKDRNCQMFFHVQYIGHRDCMTCKAHSPSVQYIGQRCECESSSPWRFKLCVTVKSPYATNIDMCFHFHNFGKLDELGVFNVGLPKKSKRYNRTLHWIH